MKHQRSYAALAISVVVAAGELVFGLRAQSVSLIADAVHACADCVAIVIMLLAMRPRLETIGAFSNAALLFAITGFVAYGAVQRFSHPAHPEGGTMALVAAVALVGNAIAGVLLLRKVDESVNRRGAFLNVAGDAFGSLAVMIAGALTIWTHRAWIDPAVSLVVCGVIVLAVAHLATEAWRVHSSEAAS